ncbi:MAG: transketolase [Bacillota bacterium]|nr:transketolase [Bacillota bacterium]
MEKRGKNMAMDYQALRKKANDIRIGIIKSVYSAGSGHPGGSLSAADILTVLYFKEMNIDPENPRMPGRDKFVLSKGHASPGIYSTLAERGFFPKEELLTFRKMGSKLQGHPDMKKVPGIEMSTGSLGQGFSAAVGMALANKLDKDQGRIYVLMGDGELQEGMVWEAFMAAAHFKLDNLTVIIDWNGLQIDGKNDDVMSVTPIDEKLKGFRWEVLTIDGHDLEEISYAFEKARECKGKPFAIIAKTVKGRGVSFMENESGWHGKAPNKEQFEQALAELEKLGGEL